MKSIFTTFAPLGLLIMLQACGSSKPLSIQQPGTDSGQASSAATSSTEIDFTTNGPKAKPSPSATPSPSPSPSPTVSVSPLNCSVSLSSSSVEVGQSVTATLVYPSGVKSYTIAVQGTALPVNTYTFTMPSAGTFPVQGTVSTDTQSATCQTNLVVNEPVTMSKLVSCGNSGLFVHTDSCVVTGATTILSVLVNTQRSIKPCTLNQTYSFSGNTLTTSNDCVATFQVIYK